MKYDFGDGPSEKNLIIYRETLTICNAHLYERTLQVNNNNNNNNITIIIITTDG